MNEVRPLRVCPYCGEARDGRPETEEHVLSRKLGGNLQPYNPLSLPVGVHEKCNSEMGEHVDGPFVNQFLIAINRSRATDDVTYFGKRPEFSTPDLQCDLWFGPAGERFYHFHAPYDEDAATGSMIKPKWASDADSGFALVRPHGATGSQLEHAVQRFRKRLRDTPVFIIDGEDVSGTVGDPVPAYLAPFAEQIAGDGHEITFHVGVGLATGDRFLAKLALGMGTLFLKPSFPESEDAALLRAVMRERDHDVREAIPVGRAPFFYDFPWRVQMLKNAIGDCHILVLQRKPQGVFLLVLLYGQYPGIIRVCGDEHCTSLVDKANIVLVISHRLNRFVWLDSIWEFLGWREGLIEAPELDELAKAVGADLPRSPPPTATPA